MDPWQSELVNQIVTMNAITGSTRRHRVFRRLDCEICKQIGDDRRNWSSERTFREIIAANYSSITGILSGLTDVAGSSWRPIHIHAAECVLPLDGRFPFSGSPPEGVVGRGLNEDDALVACLAEGCERYSAFYQGNEPTMRASYRYLGAGAVHPQDLLHFSKRQFLSREEHADVDEISIPVPFDEDIAVDWVEAKSLTGESRLVPAAYCYLRHMEPNHPFCVADSNGCAAGVDTDSAVERGLLELIERDAAAIWWYNQLPARRLPFDVFSNEVLAGFPELFARNGLKVWLLQLASDWHVPVVAAVCCVGDEASIAYAFAAGRTVEMAALSATTELVQTIRSCARVEAKAPNDPRVVWRQRTRVKDRPFLRPDRFLSTIDETQWSLTKLLERARELDFNVLVVDLSRPEVGVPVVRVVVPGMRPFMARFGPGRLYQLPVTLGLVDRLPSEELLNPDPLL